MKDIIADLPDELAEYKRLNSQLPEDVDFEPGFYCIWDRKRFFIHTRATLPLRDIEEGIGFGLWVEISRDDFDRYAKANIDDNLYKSFETEGILANEWPGFEGMRGVPVTVRTIKVNEKVYISRVNLDRPRDVLFEVALNMQKGDLETKQKLENLVKSYLD